jgi:hypothetical protein
MSSIVDHESIAADALVKFSNVEHEADGRVCNGNARRSYGIVFVDRLMPMERGAREDSEAGVFVNLLHSAVIVAVAVDVAVAVAFMF